MKRLLVFTLLVSVLALAACGSASQMTVTKGYTVTATRTASASPSPTLTLPPGTSSPVSQDWSTISPPEHLIVRNGSLNMLVSDIPRTLEDISGVATSAGGYVVNSQSYRTGERIFGSISLRVPVESFEMVMRSVANLAAEVTNQATTSEDVTAEYVDLAARLRNLEATENQLLTIMTGATAIPDVITVQRELTSVRESIEQARGRMQYLETTSALSLINVTLEQSSLGVDLSANRAVVNPGENINFTAQIYGGFAPFSYEWEFGDGKKSTLSAPAHAYSKPGTYAVSLRVTDDRGNSYTEKRDDYITVLASGWNISRVFEASWQALITFGKGFASVCVVLLTFSPVWLTPVIIIWIAKHRRKNSRR